MPKRSIRSLAFRRNILSAGGGILGAAAVFGVTVLIFLQSGFVSK